ncbi:MAG: hypothetical protein ACYST5_21235 [Planctomycetota bacterium]
MSRNPALCQSCLHPCLPRHLYRVFCAGSTGAGTGGAGTGAEHKLIKHPTIKAVLLIDNRIIAVSCRNFNRNAGLLGRSGLGKTD